MNSLSLKLFLLFYSILYCDAQKLTTKDCVKINDNYWSQIWSSEFDDGKNWEKNFWIEDNLNICRKNEIEHQNCNFAENIETAGGYAFLKAKHLAYHNENYTGSDMTTRQFFTYGRYEIRARLPKGEFLEPSILTKADEDFAKSGRFHILTFVQTQSIYRGIFYQNLTHPYESSTYKFRTPQAALQQLTENFHIFGLEWYPEKVRFFYDNFYGNWISFGPDKNVTSWHRIRLRLGVGGGNYADLLPTDFKELNWTCPAFIIDYVRVFEHVENTESCHSFDERNEQTPIDLEKEKHFIDLECLKFKVNAEIDDYKFHLNQTFINNSEEDIDENNSLERTKFWRCKFFTLFTHLYIFFLNIFVYFLVQNTIYGLIGMFIIVIILMAIMLVRTNRKLAKSRDENETNKANKIIELNDELDNEFENNYQFPGDDIYEEIRYQPYLALEDVYKVNEYLIMENQHTPEAEYTILSPLSQPESSKNDHYDVVPARSSKVLTTNL